MDILAKKSDAIKQFFPVPDEPSNLISRVANKLDDIQSRIQPISSYGLYSFAIPFSTFTYAIWKRNGTLFLAILIWGNPFHLIYRRTNCVVLVHNTGYIHRTASTRSTLSSKGKRLNRGLSAFRQTP